VALDRSSIEKKDFPTARQGYDKATVDAHLAAIADQVEHLTLASSASERVRAIVEAAETSAAQIQREADDAALATRQEAEQAARHAREGAGRLSELAATLTQQLDASRRQLEALVRSLPGAARGAGPEPEPGTEPRGSGLEPGPGTQAGVSSDRADAEAEAATAQPATRPAQPAPAPPEQPPAADAAAATPVGTQAASQAETPATGHADDAEASEGARLIALNMALDGSSRDETAKYLDEHFQLTDRERLLDEVYASVEG
jgi:DivIVA domain-containing protein